MTDCAPIPTPAMLSFSIDRDTGHMAVLNAAKCGCGRTHITRAQLDRVESHATAEVLMELLASLRVSERSIDVTDLSAFVNEVLGDTERL